MQIKKANNEETSTVCDAIMAHLKEAKARKIWGLCQAAKILELRLDHRRKLPVFPYCEDLDPTASEQTRGVYSLALTMDVEAYGIAWIVRQNIEEESCIRAVFPVCVSLDWAKTWQNLSEAEGFAKRFFSALEA